MASTLVLNRNAMKLTILNVEFKIRCLVVNVLTKVLEASNVFVVWVVMQLLKFVVDGGS